MDENIKLCVFAPLIGAMLVTGYNTPIIMSNNLLPKSFWFVLGNMMISFTMGYFLVTLSNLFMSIFTKKVLKE